MLKFLPDERILLESDAPSMFNSNIYDNEEEYSNYFREENNKIKNEPISVIYLAKKLAELRGVSVNDFLKIIHKNLRTLIKFL